MTGNRKLGRLPADPNRPKLKLGPRLTGAIPAHPTRVDNASLVGAWGMLANDRFGVCGPAALAHQRMQVLKYLTGVDYTASVDDVFALYRLCNPDFDPATGAGDNGVVLQDMLDQATRHGYAGVKPVAYAQVDHTNVDEMRAAVAVFGSLLYGVDLQTAQQTQTDNGGPWDYAPSGEWGGHAVLAVEYTSSASGSDIGVVTWGEVLGTTDRFEQHQLGECWAVIWPEHLQSKEFLSGLDVAGLAADYEALTGRPLPFPEPGPQPQPGPTPSPVPPGPAPGPDPADVALARAVTGWARQRHVGATKHIAQAFLAWEQAKHF